LETEILVLIIVNSVLASCAIGSLILSYLGFKREIEKEQREGENERKTTRQMLNHLEVLRSSVEANRKSIHDLEKSVEGKVAPSAVRSIEQRKAELKDEELRLKKERQEWKKLTDVAKGIGWAWKVLKEDDE
jgi:hypothetical protein